MVKPYDYERWKLECLPKSMLSQTYAVKIIKAARKRGLTLFAYPCPHCTAWHLTQNAGHPDFGPNFTVRGKKLKKVSVGYCFNSEEEET